MSTGAATGAQTPHMHAGFRACRALRRASPAVRRAAVVVEQAAGAERGPASVGRHRPALQAVRRAHDRHVRVPRLRASMRGCARRTAEQLSRAEQQRPSGWLALAPNQGSSALRNKA